MAVQQEIKSQLAKLLATEDIVVEHKHVETAQFNVQTRVLILPLWEKASNYVYDMLVGHEVGHALFTPDEEPPSHVPFHFLNVAEDARIEKLMKRKYLGIAKSFHRGYNEMHEDDFFELDGVDTNSLNLADRANLFFKIGSFLPISFSDPEKEIITLIQNAETFTETIAAAEALYNFCKQEHDNKEQVKKETEGNQEENIPEPIEGNSSSDGDSGTDDADDTDSSLSNSDGDSDVESGVGNSNHNFGSNASDLTVGTADALMGRLKDLTSSSGIENVYVEVPKVNLDTVIVSNEDVHDVIIEDFAEQTSQSAFMTKEDIFSNPDSDFLKFKRDAQKEVSYLVKEFECKKSASAYARATTSRTGVLDTRNLHTYKYNEDLFKKISVVPDGKNHGLIFVLDWSGSMQYILEDTLKQLYNLIWFCKKVQIPFEVYAFSQEFNRRHSPYYEDKYDKMVKEEVDHCERKEGFFHIDNDFSLLNFFSSKTNSKTLEEQMINIWRVSHSFRNHVCYRYPTRLCLSGTPLNESLVTLHQLIPQFQTQNNVEKVQCIVLTDGDAPQLPFNKIVNRAWEDDEFLGCVNCHGDRSFLRDRKLGRTYKLPYSHNQFTDALLENLQDTFPSTNFIGIRVIAPRDAKYFIRRYHGDDEKVINTWTKTKSCTITNSGYDAYFCISSAALSQESEFDVDDSATKAQIKRAFVKSLKTKKLNKRILGEFISLVV